MIVATPKGDITIGSAAPASWTPYRQFQAATRSGVPVTHDGAMSISAFWACVMLLARTGGSLPCEVFNDQSDVLDRVTGADVSIRLREQPNPTMSGVQFWTTLFANRVATGNAYAVKLDPTDGLVNAPELWPLPAVHVNPWRGANGQVWYRYMVPTTSEVIDIPARQMLHIVGPTLGDGLQGASPVETMRERLGVSLAASRYQQRFFLNDARPRGILSVEQSLSEDSASTIRDQWHATYGGVENSHSVAVLDHGAKFQSVSISPEDAQFIEQMKHGAAEIARMFNIPPAMIGAEGSSLTYANAAHNDNHFVKFVLRPYLREAEAALNRDPEFFGPRSPWVPRFNVEDILRPDVTAHHQMLRDDMNAGLLNANEARAEIGRDPLVELEQSDRTLEYRLANAVGAGIMTLNEARVKLGLPEVPEGDVLFDPREPSAEERENIAHQLRAEGVNDD